MNNLPPGYKKGISRVSDVVSFLYPFGGEGKKRYQQWLKKVGVGEDEYLKEAQTVGTYIHQHMEDYINLESSPITHTCVTIGKTIEEGHKYIDSIIKAYPKSKGREMVAEPVVLDKEERFQGSVDLVLINEKKKAVVIIDWKSFGIAKARFSLPNKYKKPYDKIKKGRLQFSLYAETYRQKGYCIEDIVLVYLHSTGAYPYKLELYSSDDLDDILLEFKLKTEEIVEGEIIITHNTKDMKIKLHKPTEQYGFIEIEIDGHKLDEGKTLEDKIDEAKALITYIIKN